MPYRPAPDDLDWFDAVLSGGIVDSLARPSPQDLARLDEFAVFRGRLALRAPLTQTCELVDDTGAPTGGADINQVLAIKYHQGKMYVVGYSSAETDVYLYRLETTGAAESGDAEYPKASPIATVWSSISTVPRVNMVSFEGGSATAPKQRLYIADYTGTYALAVWNSTDSTLHTGNGATNGASEDFDDDGTKEALYFPLVFTFASHMFGTDFRQVSVIDKGLLRISQPGAIPATEPGVTNNASREWWNSDAKFVPPRGEVLTAAAESAIGMVLCKRRSAHLLYGSDLASFGIRSIANAPGAVGPQAITSLPDGRVAVWSDRGPYLINGLQALDIGGQIRGRVNAVTVSQDTCLGFSIDDGLLHCLVPGTGGSPNKHLAWDVASERWVDEGTYLATGGGALAVNDIEAVPDDALAGPAAAPSSVSVTVTSDTVLDLTWTNGDTAVDTVTDVHRSTSSGFTPGAGNLIDTVLSGVAAYTDTGRSAKTTYYYKLIHRRNGQSSAASTQASGKTALARPTGLTASSYATGVHLAFTHNANGSDYVIQRKAPGGPWSTIYTEAAAASGAKTYDDTAVTCGLTYTYRVYAQEGGETDSPYSSEASWMACSTAPTISTASHTVTIVADCPSSPNVGFRWTGTFKPSDTILIERDDNGAGYASLKTVPAQDLTASDIWGRRSGAASQTLQYRLTPYDGGVVAGTPVETTQSSDNVNATVCPE